MDRTLKAVYIWIVLALVWMGLELLLYGEIQPRTVDDIMWFLFLPFIYMAVERTKSMWFWLDPSPCV